MEPSGYSKLLSMKVPHIHEMIILSLDYETFKNCGGVCKTWDDLLASESLRKKVYSVYKEEMDLELLTYAKEGQVDNMKRLLSKGANPNINIKRESPLHWGVHKKATEMWLKFSFIMEQIQR